MNFRVPDEIYTIFMQAVDRSGWDKIDVFNRMVALAGPILGADAAKANEFLYHSLMRHRSLMEIHKPTGKYKKGNGHD